MFVVEYIKPNLDMNVLGVHAAGCKVDSVVRYKFDNGYGASVVQALTPDGIPYRELAVMHDDDIVYDTPVTGDVLTWLTEDQLIVALQQVINLPERVS